MKSEMKKYFAWMVCICAVYLCIRYWDGFVDLLLIALSAATPLYAYSLFLICGAKMVPNFTKPTYTER